ncbi:uncharacterized protein LOC141837301 [Curcuma longa]|uniref:uncharacterized protein LOC141837301 n=1 Tax=Curcuma longa TaxID=136217 RepID=UPI003D9F69A5
MIRKPSTEGIEISQCMVMVLMAQKRAFVLFMIIIMISLPSTASGGRESRNFVKYAAPSKTTTKEYYAVSDHNRADEVDESPTVRWRMLMKVNTKDYGSADPPPSLGKPPSERIPSKPPSKLIPS